MAERRIQGRPAAPGFFAGTLHVEAARAVAAAEIAAGEAGARALRAAMARAGAALAALAARMQGEAGDIIGFQLALLEDDALTEGAFHAIEAGVPADAAFAAALDAEITDCQTSGDAVFAARAADLSDLRDRVLAALRGEAPAAAAAPGSIIVAADFTPSRFLEQDWSRGGALVLAGGSASGHVAILARGRGVPMIAGAPVAGLASGMQALVQADAGLLVAEPAAPSRAAFVAAQAAADAAASGAAEFALRPALTRDGTPVAVHLNIAGLADIAGLDPAICDGIGLTRTEFLFQGAALPDEAAQYAFYRRLVDWARGRPVVIRTLDAGGDKPVKGVTIDGESNPFLGLRGIRLSLAGPDIFRVQLRALLRASAHGALKIMLPMVTVPVELEAARALLADEAAGLRAAGAAIGQPELGIMVEVPACALALDLFDADFFSIGSNDLTQYVTAAGRDMASVAALADAAHPAVLRLIALCAAHGVTSGRSVSLCGDAAADPRLVPLLLDAGLRSLSVAPPFAGLVKQAIAAHDLRKKFRGETT